MDSKHFLASKTFQGIIGMVLVALLGEFLSDSEAAKVAEGIGFLVSTCWAAYGRSVAEGTVSVKGRGKGGGKATAAMLMILCVGMSTGCAVKKVSEHPAHEQARFYAQELGRTYLDMSNGYIAAFPQLSKDQQVWAGKEVKPALEKIKLLTQMTLSAAISWSVLEEKIWKIESETDGKAGAELQAVLAKRDAAREKYQTLAKETNELITAAQAFYKSFKLEM
ncbi:MAG: hypothetical protein ACNI27_07060 [Desulfovibrio sp.]